RMSHSEQHTLSDTDEEAAAEVRARQYEGTSAFAAASSAAAMPPPLEYPSEGEHEYADEVYCEHRPSSDDDFPAYNPADFESEKEEGGNNEGEVEVRPEYAEEEEEFDEASLFNNPENAKVEYVGGYQMDIDDKIVVDDSFLVTTEPGAISRMVVIDAANILHGLTPLMEGNNTPEAGMQKVDAAYILSLVRFFVFKGIECIVVTQHKYEMDNVIDNSFITKTLKDMGLLITMDNTYDDLVLFTVAGEFDAVILSEDQFRDEKAQPGFLTPNVNRALELKVAPIYPRLRGDFLPKEHWGKVSRNGHFVVDHLMRFAGDTDVLRKKFFTTAARGGHRFELVQEKYESWLRRKDQVLKQLEGLLAQIQPIMKTIREDVALLPRGN
ncbi:hypothetical protein PENTCL1PPCAC_10469, partial [Pristionchus entomophagus]